MMKRVFPPELNWIWGSLDREAGLLHRLLHGHVGDTADARRVPRKVGAALTLRDFHDRLLKIGSLPPTLVREELLR